MLDKDLLSAISKGNEQAFAILYKRYYAKLNQFLSKVSYSELGISEDILQEAFLRIWLNRDKLSEIENFQAWIYKIVRIESLTLIKKEVHIRNKANRLEQQYNHNILPKQEFPRVMEFEEIKSIISETVNKMPEQRKKIYLLSREDGKSAQEIADILHISSYTVYNTLTTALKQIRTILLQKGYSISLLIYFILKFF